MSASTKKFPATLTAEGYASSHSAFVFPALDGRTCFVDLRTGKSHETAYLVYVGRSVTADDILQKLTVDPCDHDRVQALAESLITELQQFKIGNVVAVEHNEGDRVYLRLVATSPKSPPGPRLS
jgi:hypothetical protein